MSRTAIALLLAAPLALAAPAAGARSAFDGAYAGASIAYSQLDGDASTTLAGNTASGSLDGDGFSYGAYAGFGWTLGPAYLGAEANFDLDDTRADTSANSTTIRIGSEESYGAGLRAGVTLSDFLADVLIYGRADRQWTDMKLSGSLANVAPLGNETDRRVAWRYGGGVEVAFNSDLWVRMEYTRTDYGTLLLPGTTATVTADPEVDRFRIGVAFRFF
ncbi:MAG TPA: outer membrane beta-barrel protein [Azospirillaceae bacterium]|nr:outer membrane beta-barrel protein [Azospirillaceae bacterium]